MELSLLFAIIAFSGLLIAVVFDKTALGMAVSSIGIGMFLLVKMVEWA